MVQLFEHCKTVFEAMNGYFSFCCRPEAIQSQADIDIKRITKKIEANGLWQQLQLRKGYPIEEECGWSDQSNNNVDVKIQNSTSFPSKDLCQFFITAKQKKRNDVRLRAMRSECSVEVKPFFWMSHLFSKKLLLSEMIWERKWRKLRGTRSIKTTEWLLIARSTRPTEHLQHHFLIFLDCSVQKFIDSIKIAA